MPVRCICVNYVFNTTGLSPNFKCVLPSIYMRTFMMNRIHSRMNVQPLFSISYEMEFASKSLTPTARTLRRYLNANSNTRSTFSRGILLLILRAETALFSKRIRKNVSKHFQCRREIMEWHRPAIVI